MQYAPGRMSRRAQALVELALVLPLLCALLLIIMDFGYLMYVQLSLQTATREGMHAGIYDNQYTIAQIQDIMLTADGRLGTDTSRNLARGEITVQYRAAGADAARGTPFPTVEITVSHTHRFLVPFLLANIAHTAPTIALKSHAWAIRVPGLVLN